MPTKISELPAVVTLATSDLVAVVNAGVTSKATVAQVRGAAPTTPTGTGVRKVAAGVENGAASLILNDDVDAAAAIVVSKLAAGTNSHVLTTTGGVPVWAAPVGAAPLGTDGDAQIKNGTALAAGYDRHATNLVQASKPRVGNATPFASEGRATQPMADANQTAGAAIYSRQMVKATGANTNARTLTLPHPASEDASYAKPSHNACTGANLVASTGTGTTVSLPPGAKTILLHTPDGVAFALDTVEYLQFDGNSGDTRAAAGKIRLTPYTTDIIACRARDGSGDRVALSQWAPTVTTNELWLGGGQVTITPYDRVVLRGGEFVRCLVGSGGSTWRATPDGTQFGDDGTNTYNTFGGGTGIIGLRNASVVPTTNPVLGIAIYSEAGVLKYRQPAGTIVTLSGGGGGTPGGSTGEIQYNNAGAFAGATDVKAGAGFLSTGAAPAVVGQIRLTTSSTGLAPVISHRYSGVDYDILQTRADSAQLQWGHASFRSSIYADGIDLVVGGGAAHQLFVAGNVALKLDVNTLQSLTPIVGFTSPYGVHGVGVQAMADAPQIPAASVYINNTIKTTGALTANRTLVFPAKTDANAYTKIINNACTGAFGVVVGDAGGGTTVTVANGKSAMVLFDSRGATRLTPDT